MSDLDQPAPTRRPTSWTVFGVINIVFGGLGALGALVALAMLASGHQAHDDSNPVTRLMADSAGYHLFAKISTPLGLIATGVLVAAGIGLLMNRGWGRTLSLAYAWYAILAGIVGLVVSWLLLIAPLLEQAQAKEGIERATLLGGAIGGLAGGVFALVYPVLLLVFMRKDVRLASGTVAPAAEDNPYQAPRA